MKQIAFFAFTAFCMALNASATYSIATPSYKLEADASLHTPLNLPYKDGGFLHTAAPDSLPPALPLNFETDDQLFKNNQKEPVISIVADPKDATNRVLQLKGREFADKSATLKLGTPLDVITASLITFRVYAPQAGIFMSLILMNEVGRIGVQVRTIASGWQKLRFDFSGKTGVFNEIALEMEYFNPDTATFFFDDIASAEPTDPALPLNFESADQLFSPDGSGVVYTRVADPQNSSDTVLRVVHAGTNADESGFLNLGIPVDLSTKPEISLRLHAPRAGIPVQLGFENFVVDVPNPSAQDTTTRSGWQELLFDLGIQPGVYRRMLLAINFDTARADTFFVDDIAQLLPPDPVTLPVHFEGGIVTANDFTDNSSRITTTVIPNPHQGDENLSENVAKIVIKKGSVLFKPRTTLGLSVPVAFNGKTGIGMKVYAPKANTPFTLGLSSGDVNSRIERNASTVSANAWEVVEFDFDGVTEDDYNQINFVWRDQTEDLTVFIDDIEVVEIVYDATLKTVQVEGALDVTLDSVKGIYTAMLPSRTTTVPDVDPTPTDPRASAQTFPAKKLSDTASVVVTAWDKKTTKTYLVVFVVENALGLTGEFGFIGYPNPVTDMLTLQLADRKVLGAYSLLVMDASGRSREVKITQEGNSIKLDVRPLASGLYFIRLQHGKEEFVLRFIKR